MNPQLDNNVDAALQQAGKTRSGNTIMELVVMSSTQEIEGSAQGKQAHEAFDRALKELDPLAIYESVADLYHLYAEQMFWTAWKLRGNPDLLAELIEPE